MRSCFALVLAAAVGMSSCDRVKTVVDRIRKQHPAKTAAPTTPAAGPDARVVTELTEGTYPAFLTQPMRLVVIDFHADWCGSCRKLSPILDRLAEGHHGTVVVGKVNVDKCRNLAAKEGIRSIPEVRMYLDGKQVDRFVGVLPEDEIARRWATLTKGRSLFLPPAAGGPLPASDGKSSGSPPPPPAGSPGSPIQPMPKDWVPAPFERPKK